MAINPIHINAENPKTTYRDAKGPVQTYNNVKPLPPKGHLVDDNFVSVPKYFIKDTIYDMKAIKDGFKGNANDHQLGRLNDVGLKLSGVGIATMLAANTSNPLARIMEYAGLGTFLTVMSLYPKVAINTPSRLIHGFDIGKEYIDDQGRKKSVFQDSNYIPFDMYQGGLPEEDLNIIGDQMGIPRGIKNRYDLIKEQMRKNAIQSNTLWMMTAGVVPVLTALSCFGIERAASPILENYRNNKYNKKISELLSNTTKMSENLDSIQTNKFSVDVEKMLQTMKNKSLSNKEVDNLVQILAQNFEDGTKDGLKEDLSKILTSNKDGMQTFIIDEGSPKNILNVIKKNISIRNKEIADRVFVPTEDELSTILSKYKQGITSEQVYDLKHELKQFFETRISREDKNTQRILKTNLDRIVNSISTEIQTKPAMIITDEGFNDIVKFAKIMGEFNINKLALDKCENFKIEHAEETVLAKAYINFEKTFLDILGVSQKELKAARESKQLAAELLDTKLKALVKDEARYTNAIEKLTKVMSEMDIKLDGNDSKNSVLKDLITAIENNYNKTAKRLSSIGRFSHTVDRLVKEDVSTLSPTLNSKEHLFALLDGNIANDFKDVSYFGMDDIGRKNYAKYNAKGVGSEKSHAVTKIVERYQGVRNSFMRILHLADIYKRPETTDKYGTKILDYAKNILMNGTSTDFTLKLNADNTPVFYKDIMGSLFYNGLDKATENGLAASKDLRTGDQFGRFRVFFNRFADIVGNNNADFTKPLHYLGFNVPNKYKKSSNTQKVLFNLVAQNPAEFVKNAAARRYGDQKWMRIVSAIGGSVLGVAVLAQFGFGKIRNSHNIKKQGVEDANK